MSALPTIIARVQRVFDIAADPQAVNAQLAEDPILATLASLAAAVVADPHVLGAGRTLTECGGMVLTGGVRLHFVGPGPIDVEADVAEINNRTREVVLRGNVKLTLPQGIGPSHRLYDQLRRT